MPPLLSGTSERLSSVSSDLYTKEYFYEDISDRTTGLVSSLGYIGLPTAFEFIYTYDDLGNIATYEALGQDNIVYTYDDLGQLLSAVGDQTYTYTYDSAGNILTANGHTYTYGNANWKDLLTAFDGQSITYDASGNPLSYYNGTRWNFTWKNGRSLATATDGTTSVSYAYDSDGLRTSKMVGGVVHNYFYASGQLLRETYGSNVLDFCYDANGYPYALKYNGTTYYYITNLQGDVMYLVDSTGATVAAYEYDPYGNILSVTGSMAEINPLCYRGYYYDAETELYYLQSRFYDPVVGRFINADSYASTGQGFTGNNMFAFCNNSPICLADYAGEDAIYVATTGDDGLPIVGHARLYLQDDKGKWYLTEFSGDKNDKKSACIVLEGKSLKEIKAYLASPKVHSVYMTGDFNKSYGLAEYYYKYEKDYGGYDFMFNNCLHYVKEVLRKGSPNIKQYKIYFYHLTNIPMDFYRCLNSVPVWPKISTKSISVVKPFKIKRLF